MSALEYYIVSVTVLTFANAIAALGFNLQIGFTGIVNFAILLSVAAGAYGTAVAGLGPAAAGGYTHYIGGFGWAFPWNALFGVGCALASSVVLGVIALSRLRTDYLALMLVSVLQGFQALVGNETRLFNGAYGIGGVPGPWDQALSPENWQWLMLGMATVALVGSYALVARLTNSPLGRALRAVREDEEVAQSLARNTWRLKMVAFVVGSGLAGLSGALLVLYIGAWSTGSWQTNEVLFLLAAVIVGGRGRNLGVVFGTILVTGVFIQASSLLPQFGPLLSIQPQLQVLFIGGLLLIFLWFRPEGIFPERKEKFERLSEAQSAGEPLPVTAGAR